MKLHPRVTRSVVELVKRFEGLRRRAARLADGGWTVGYGHTRSAREGAVVSPEDAEALLYYDLSEVAQKVEAWTFTPLNQNQFEALTAFAFNIGVENFRGSTVLKRVNEGQHLMAAAAFELWRKADFGGEDLVVDALVRRRAAEKAHYLTPPEGFRPSPTPVLRPTFDHSVIEVAANSRAGLAAAVVDVPLEGDDATAIVEQRPDPDGLERASGPVPASVPTARLHQLFSEKPTEPMVAPEAPPFALQEEPDVWDRTAAAAANDAPSADALPSLEVPPAPNAAPPSSRFDPPPPFMVRPAVAEGAADPQPLFDAPSTRSPFAQAIPGEDHNDALEAEEVMRGHEPGPLHDRSMIYFSIGLLGVALFAASLFSMFSGKANPVNLVIGLMGILLMTPAGGYFLLRFLNKRDGMLEV